MGGWVGLSASFEDKKNLLLQRGSISGSPRPKHSHYTDSHLIWNTGGMCLKGMRKTMRYFLPPFIIQSVRYKTISKTYAVEPKILHYLHLHLQLHLLLFILCRILLSSLTLQYFFIPHMIGPTDLLHPFLAPLFKMLFIIYFPKCFSTAQSYAPNVALHYFLSEI